MNIINAKSAEFPMMAQFDTHAYIRSEITCFYFHLARCKTFSGIKNLSEYLDSLIDFIRLKMETEKLQYMVYLEYLYNLIAQTRDVSRGKGERDLTYMMICVWYKYYPNLAMKAFKLLMDEHMGCWSDVKYFCDFIVSKSVFSKMTKEWMMRCVINVALYQFDRDRFVWDNIMSSYLKAREKNPDTKRPIARDHISNVCKWIPRESGKFGWLFENFVIQWNFTHMPFVFENLGNGEHYVRTMNKLRMNFRKMVTGLNKQLETEQIRQCSKNWAELSPKKTPLGLLLKDKKAFTYDGLNVDENEDIDIDRLQSSINYKDYFYFNSEFNLYGFKAEGEVDGNVVEVGPKTSTYYSLGTYVKQALGLLQEVRTDDVSCRIHFLNNVWRKNVLMHFGINGLLIQNDLTNMLPIVDVSMDLDSDARNNAIGMGILIAQVSSLKRMILCEHNCMCMDVPVETDFVDLIYQVCEAMEGATGLQVMNVVKFLKQGTPLLDDNIYYVFLSSDTNILKNQELWIRSDLMTNKFVHFVFWNVGTCLEGHELETVELQNALYLSGASPVLLYHLNRLGVRKMDTFDYLGHLFNTGRYSAFKAAFVMGLYNVD